MTVSCLLNLTERCTFKVQTWRAKVYWYCIIRRSRFFFFFLVENDIIKYNNAIASKCHCQYAHFANQIKKQIGKLYYDTNECKFLLTVVCSAKILLLNLHWKKK